MTDKDRTIFITSFHGLVSRVLEAGVAWHLLASGVKIVLLVPDFKKDYFRTTFGAYPAVVVEGVAENLSRRTRALHQMTFPLLYTTTMKIIRRSDRDYTSIGRFLVTQGIASTLGRFRFIRALFRFVNEHFGGPDLFARYFEKYKPDLVFSTDSKHILDSELVREAKRRGIRTVGMVRSWDYLTAKGIMRVKPDTMVVHNEIIKGEAVRYADMNARDVAVVGMPHFDPYRNEPRVSRADFFKTLGVDAGKRLIFLAPWGEKFSDIDSDIFALLEKAIKSGDLPRDMHVLVRVPPGDVLALGLKNTYEHLTFDYPGISFSGRHRKENEMGLSDILRLADSLFHSEIVVSSASTISIDAAAFDKPTILMAFDGNTQREYYQSVRHYYDFDHMQHVIKAAGIRLAYSQEALVALIREYLKQPEKDQNGRARITSEQCGALDGKASERLARLLLARLT